MHCLWFAEGSAVMLQVTVKRSEWNGNTLERVAGSVLLTVSGTRCCLGFACKAAGIPDSELYGRGYVHNLRDGIELIPASLLLLVEDRGSVDGLFQSDISQILTEVNDNYRRLSIPAFNTLAEKEAFLIEKGRLAGIEFTFVD
jgi:hypothetical protein